MSGVAVTKIVAVGRMVAVGVSVGSAVNVAVTVGVSVKVGVAVAPINGTLLQANADNNRTQMPIFILFT